MFTRNDFYKHLQQLTHNRKFLIGYSGGLDSHVLLHAFKQLRDQYPDIILQAVHINHSLSKNADHWARHCENVCKELNIPYLQRTIQITRKHSQSLEALAREARYQVFAEILPPDYSLVVAHTQSDQAETVLLQLFRGAGPKGLAAMPQKVKFAKSELLRPLLNFTRKELEVYAQQEQLKWIDDESNFNKKFGRNFIRHDIIPLLQQRWPAIEETLSRSAKHCAESSELLSMLAYYDLQNARGSKPRTLSVAALLSLEESRQRNVLREWLRSLNFSQASDIKLCQIIHEVLLAREDAKPLVKWKGVEVRRYQDDVYAQQPQQKINPSWESTWDTQTPLHLPNGLYLFAKKVPGMGLAKTKLAGKIIIKFRHGGERCQPQGRKGSHPLKKLFQEWQIPPWQRDQIPLLYVGEKLAAVVDYCVCEEFAAKENEAGITLLCYSEINKPC